MSAKSYRQHIETDHPLLSEVFGSAEVAAPGSVAVLEDALTDVKARFFYKGTRGRTGFDQLLENLRRAAPGERVLINCYDLSCLLASHFRITGWGPEDAFVVFCDRLLTEEMARVDFHACNLLRCGDETFWIEPEVLEATRLSGDEILETYKVRLVFNDTHIYFTEDEKRRVVMSDMPAIGQQVFLYGRGHTETQAVYSDSRFDALVAGYFESGRLECDDDLAEKALACGLLANEDGGYSAGPRLMLVPRAAELELRNRIEPAIDVYLGIVSKTVPALRAAYEAGEAARSFDWSQVCHTIVAGMLIDLSVGVNLKLAADVRGTIGDAVIWAFENISAENGFGVQWNVGSHPSRAAAQLWHRTVTRQPLRLEKAMSDALVQLARGEAEVSSSREWLFLKFTKLVREGKVVPPVFGPDDTTRLLEPLMSAGVELVEKAVTPAFEMAARDPWWGRLNEDASYRHAVVRLVLEYATDRVVSAGLLPPFPTGEVDVTWGRWVWIEPDDSPGRLVPPSFDAQPAEA